MRQQIKISKFKSVGFFARLIKSFFYSLSGFRFLLLNERAFQQELIFFAFSIFVAAILGLNHAVLMVILATLILVVESINTAIEIVCDEITDIYNENIKIAKDVSSFAVFLLIFFYTVIFFIALLGW